MRVYLAAIAVSVVAHWALLGGLSRAAREAPKPTRVLEIAVIRPPPVPVEIAPPPPVPEPEKRPTKRPPPPPDATLQKPPPDQTPPPTDQRPSEEPPAPVFGISMSSTVSGNSGFSMRVGNTTMKEPDKERLKPSDVKPYAAPPERFVPVYALASPPAQVGDCREAYPEAARSARVQGRIKLDVLVRADGSVGEVTPLNKLGYGLEETAVRALMRCRFKPGNDGTQAVATRITYTYTFTYEEAD